MASIWLKNGRDKSVRLHHPWIFSGAIDHLQGDPQMGETVEVRSAAGDWLAWADSIGNMKVLDAWRSAIAR